MTLVECTRCVMNSVVDPPLVLTDGICQHCSRYGQLLTSRIVPSDQRAAKLAGLVETVSRTGRKAPYDCAIEVSGVVDSSYAALQVKRLDVRPLAVHDDNGWDSALAVLNIERLLKRSISTFTLRCSDLMSSTTFKEPSCTLLPQMPISRPITRFKPRYGGSLVNTAFATSCQEWISPLNRLVSRRGRMAIPIGATSKTSIEGLAELE